MSTNSETEDSVSESSFGWVDIGENNPKGKKINDTSEKYMSSDREDGSDTTEFEGDDSNNPVNLMRHQQVEHTEDSSVIKDVPPSAEEQSNGLNISLNETSITSVPDNSQHEDEDSGEQEESSEEDKKPLKPLTKPLIVKKERFSHTLSDDDNVDSHVTRRSVRLKSESNRPGQETKKTTSLIEGALTDLSQTLSFNIGANEDVWVVQCPKEISESSLKGKTINFNGITRIDQFESNILRTPQIEPINLLLPKAPGKIINIVPKGHIVFKEKETTPQAVHPVPREENIFSPPVGLKLRHPLFGTEFPFKEEPFTVPQTKKKKKKKHHDSSVEEEHSVTENGVISADTHADLDNQLSSPTLHKKSKKKKKHADKNSLHNTYENSSSDSLNISQSSLSINHSQEDKNFETKGCVNTNYLSDTVHKKLKKEKKMLLKGSDGINSKSTKKENEFSDELNNRVSLVTSSQELDNDTVKRKKKKKHKYEKELEPEDIKPIIKQAPDEYDEYSTSLLTQRLHESANDPLVHTSSDVFKKKKKKKDKEYYHEVTNLSSEIVDDDSFVPSHKKRKKVKVDHHKNEEEHVSIKKTKKSSLSHSIHKYSPIGNFSQMDDEALVKEEPEHINDNYPIETLHKKKKKKKKELD